MMLTLAAVTEIIVDPKAIQPRGAATFTKQVSFVEEPNCFSGFVAVINLFLAYLLLI